MGGVRSSSSSATPQPSASRSSSWGKASVPEEQQAPEGAAEVAALGQQQHLQPAAAGGGTAPQGVDDAASDSATAEEGSLEYLYATQRATEVLLSKPPMGLKMASVTVDEEDGTPLGAQVEAVHRKSNGFGVLEAGDLLGEVVVHAPGEDDERYDLVDVAFDDIMALLKSVAKGLKKGVHTTLVVFRPM